MKRFIIPTATAIALVASAGLAAAQPSGGHERPGMGRSDGGGGAPRGEQGRAPGDGAGRGQLQRSPGVQSEGRSIERGQRGMERGANQDRREPNRSAEQRRSSERGRDVRREQVDRRRGTEQGRTRESQRRDQQRQADRDRSRQRDADQRRNSDRQRAEQEHRRNADRQRLDQRQRNTERQRDRQQADRQRLDRERNAQGRDRDQQTSGRRTEDRVTQRHEEFRRERLRLSTEQRGRLHDAFDFRRARVSNVRFDYHVGHRVPRHVHLYPVPREVISFFPYYRDYSYFVVNDEICIVDPRTYEVVDVIDQEYRSAPSRPEVAHLSLSGREIALVRDSIPPDYPSADVRLRLALGATIPPEVELHEFATIVIDRVSVLRDYRFLVAEDQIVIVEPRDRSIALVIDRR